VSGQDAILYILARLLLCVVIIFELIILEPSISYPPGDIIRSI
jgi:hypothetical protein